MKRKGIEDVSKEKRMHTEIKRWTEDEHHDHTSWTTVSCSTVIWYGLSTRALLLSERKLGLRRADGRVDEATGAGMANPVNGESPGIGDTARIPAGIDGTCAVEYAYGCIMVGEGGG